MLTCCERSQDLVVCFLDFEKVCDISTEKSYREHGEMRTALATLIQSVCVGLDDKGGGHIEL